jgi:hypothetical protein
MLLVYLAIDLANPFVPGAFCFTPEKGLAWVEAMSHPRPKLGTVSPEAMAPALPSHVTPTEGARERPSEPVRTPDLTAWLAGIRTRDPSTRDLLPPDSEDH